MIGAGVIATIENGVAEDGFGSAVTEWLTKNNFTGRVLRFGWPDRFVPHGSMKNFADQFGLGESAVAASIAKAMDFDPRDLTNKLIHATVIS